jgi:hypothetical protein
LPTGQRENPLSLTRFLLRSFPEGDGKRAGFVTASRQRVFPQFRGLELAKCPFSDRVRTLLPKLRAADEGSAKEVENEMRTVA